MKLEIAKDYRDNTCMVAIHAHPGSSPLILSDLNTDELEDLESELETIASQIRDFRMKNFPESTEIE